MRSLRRRRSRASALVLAALLCLLPSPAGAQIDKLLKGLGQGSQGSGLSDAKIGAGLKEALQAATEKAVSLTGKTDGYFANQAIKILNGNDTAATLFFKSKTSPQLTAAFRPVISKSMGEVGVTRQYKDLVSRFDAIPFARSQAFDLDGYVVDKGLAGLFQVLGEQEKQIRTNPSARATDLLKEVFKR